MSFESVLSSGKKSEVSCVSLEWAMMLKWLKLKDVTISSE